MVMFLLKKSFFSVGCIDYVFFYKYVLLFDFYMIIDKKKYLVRIL